MLLVIYAPGGDLGCKRVMCLTSSFLVDRVATSLGRK